jgi:hypothetical protein
MTRTLRYVRYAFSIGCGLVAIVLCLLWVRSYSSYTEFHAGPKLRLAWWYGSITTYTALKSDPYFNQYHAFVPCWLSVAVALAFIPVGWIHRRFSLRTLLIATTLVAVVMGLIIYSGSK